jgi:hypothetical protein
MRKMFRPRSISVIEYFVSGADTTFPWKTVKAVTFFLTIILGATQSIPVFAEPVTLYCEHFRLVRDPGISEDPPVRLRDFVLKIFPDEGQWVIAHVQEDGNLARANSFRIAGANNASPNEIILYQSSFAGRVDAETTLDTASLTYSDLEYRYSGKINRHTQAKCVEIK